MVNFPLIVTLGLGVLGTSIQSLLGPFFPREAKTKDINDSTIGLIFGIYPIFASLSSPIFGMILSKAGRKRVLLCSGLISVIVIQNTGSLLLAFLPNFDKHPFVAVSIVARILQGVGGAGLIVTVVAIISDNYRQQMEKLFGVQQALAGLAMIVGPILGFGLFLLGGFSFIFFVFSTIFFSGLLLVACIIPNDIQAPITKEPVSWRLLMSVKTVPLDCVLVAFAFGSLGSLEPLLGNFLSKQFSSGSLTTALAFVIPTVAYPLTVFISSKFFSHVQSKDKMSLGLLTIGLALMIIGPAESSFVPHSLTGTLFGVFGIGVGLALSMVPALPDMVNFATGELPHIEGSLISDRVSSLVGLSMFVGKGIFASLAGVICDKLEFELTMASIGAALLVYLAVFRVLTKDLRSVKHARRIREKGMMTESELKETKKSFYLLEEEDI